jgi:hypothetical protein
LAIIATLGINLSHTLPLEEAAHLTKKEEGLALVEKAPFLLFNSSDFTEFRFTEKLIRDFRGNKPLLIESE